MIRVKICGLMNEEDLNFCVQAGAHCAGFVVNYPEPVPWNLDIDRARKLVQKVPPFVSSCVVSGGPVESILNMARTVRPDMIQLHYQETLNETEVIAERLSLMGIKTIKALRINSQGQCVFEMADPAAAARALSNSKLSALVVDSYTAARAGGTGVAVDLNTFRIVKQESNLPVILAGGLNPDNIRQMIKETNPYAVDVLTGVEEYPGRKDRAKLLSFIQNINP